MNRECRDREAPVKIKKVVSVLPNDYGQLENIPTLNGVSLLGNLSGKDLNLLPTQKDEYETTTVESAAKGGYVVCLGASEPQKVPISEFLEQSKNVMTTDELKTDVRIGTIQLVIMK